MRVTDEKMELRACRQSTGIHIENSDCELELKVKEARFGARIWDKCTDLAEAASPSLGFRV
jgi:hypothetical protein